MLLVWSSDSSPFLTNSVASRFPIAVVPASRYAMAESGVNITLEAITGHIVSSFNTLSRSGVKIRNLDAQQNQPVTGLENWCGSFPMIFLKIANKHLIMKDWNPCFDHAMGSS